MRKKIEAILSELRPMIQADGGDIKLIDVTQDGIVQIHWEGLCPDCPGSMMPLKAALEKMVKDQVPEVRKVITV